MSDPRDAGPVSQPPYDPARLPIYGSPQQQPAYGSPPPIYGATPQQPYGAAPGPYYYGAPVPARNGFAVAALVLGICGFVLTPIPLFIGLVLGGIPDILAVIFGIVGITRAQTTRVGLGMAVAGLVLGGLGFVSIFFGAGTIW